MISYSDFVLAERPWAYWPLNDPLSFSTSGENQYFLDVSGNNRHLTARSANVFTYQSEFYHLDDKPNFPSDSLPVRSVRVLGNCDNFNRIAAESDSYIFLESGTNVHINDIDEPNYYTSHQLFRRKVRGEFILGLPVASANPKTGCGLSSYPILSIGGLTLWMNSVYTSLCPGCPCSFLNSYLSLSYPVRTAIYNQFGIEYTSNFGPYVFWASETEFLAENCRFIFEFEYYSDTHMRFTMWRDMAFVFQTDVVFPSEPIFEVNNFIRRYFLYTSYYTDVAVFCATGGVSNLSVYYDKNIDDSYLVRSWIALNTVYLPGLSVDITEISDNLFTNINQGAIPNSTVMQLDSLLIRGISHKRFTNIDVDEIDDGYKITLFVGDTQNDSLTQNYWVPDFKIGDIISLDGTGQPGLNSCWRVESLVFNGIVFTTNTPFQNETGHFIVKRAPIGGRRMG